VAIERRAPGGGNEFPAGPALDDALSELERKLERVRTFYEQYFMGMEKMEPQVARKEVHRTILLYAQQHIRNTGQRFRFHSLQQKWNIYTTYWNRTMREIEAGTYKRDVARVTRKLGRKGMQLPEEAAVELGLRHRRGALAGGAESAAPPLPQAEPTSPSDTSATEPTPTAAAAQSVAAAAATPPLPTPARPRSPTPPSARAPEPAPRRPPMPTPPPPGVSDEQMQALYRRFVQAKRMIGDAGADSVRYESLIATVAKQTPAIMQKYGCNQVDFTVVIRDDKVVLKAIPKATPRK
jgi:hypothetical protein